MLEVGVILTGMIEEENRLLAMRVSNLSHTTLASRIALLVSAALVMLLALLAVSGATRRLSELEIAYRRLGEEKAGRMSAQSQVYQLQKMEAVGQLTGGIAHDFNNMLAVLIGSLDIALRRLAADDKNKVAEYIENAIAGAERAATLTARLLAFSRQQPLIPKILDINKLIGGTSEMLRRTLGERIEIETVLAGGLWRVNADPAQIESSLVNLALNARDAMSDGGKLTIETANCELDERYSATHEEVSAGQYILLSVTDTGGGMPSDVRSRAFEPFYTTKEVGKGTGLGLSQIFGFIKQSRGHIEIYSELGQGTTVKLYLPRYVSDEGNSDQSGVARHVPGGRPEEIILVVEDEADVRRTTVDALRELGYSVVQAADGREALAQLAAQPQIDLLFTDVVMPGLTGRQLADRAAEEWPALKILYTTGYTRNAVVHNGVVDHDVALLAKPFSVEALARKIREVLDA
jgi:signal transduction histidine kinase